MRARRATATLALIALVVAASGAHAAAPPTVDTCTLATKPEVAGALGTSMRNGRRLSGNGACQYRALAGRGGSSATITERAGDVAYLRAYLKNAHAELGVDPRPLAGLGDAAARWPGNVALLRHHRFALVTILGITGAKGEHAALAIARAVAKRL